MVFTKCNERSLRNLSSLKMNEDTQPDANAAMMMLQIKLRAANVDKLVNKQEKLKKTIKEQKQEIDKLHENLLAKENDLKSMQNRTDENLNFKCKLEELLQANEKKDTVIQTQNVSLQQSEERWRKAEDALQKLSKELQELKRKLEIKEDTINEKEKKITELTAAVAKEKNASKRTIEEISESPYNFESIFDIHDIQPRDAKVPRTQSSETYMEESHTAESCKKSPSKKATNKRIAMENIVTSSPIPSHRLIELECPSSPIHTTEIIQNVKVQTKDTASNETCSGITSLYNKPNSESESVSLTKDEDPMSSKQSISSNENKKAIPHRGNVGIKFLKPGSQRTPYLKKHKKKVANFSICGKLDSESIPFPYISCKQPPPEYVDENAFVPLHAGKIFKRLQKIENILNIDPQEDKESTVNDERKEPVMLGCMPNVSTNVSKETYTDKKMIKGDKMISETKEKAKRVSRKITTESTNEIKESREFTSSDLDEEIKMSTKAMSRKRRHELLFGDTNTSSKNICPAKMRPTTISQNPCSTEKGDDVWTPERFSRYDAVKCNTKDSNESAKARAIAVLSKKPLMPAKKPSLRQEPVAMLAEDLCISDSSDQDPSSPLKPKEGLHIGDGIKRLHNTATKSNVNPIGQNVASTSTSVIQCDDYKKPITLTTRNRTTASKKERPCQATPIVDETIVPTTLTAPKERLQTKSNEAQSIASVPSTNMPKENSKGARMAKTFKHKKFGDAEEFIPLGKSYSTLKTPTERAATGINVAKVKQDKTQETETNLVSNHPATFDKSEPKPTKENGSNCRAESTKTPLNSDTRQNKTRLQEKYSNFISAGHYQGDQAVLPKVPIDEAELADNPCLVPEVVQNCKKAVDVHCSEINSNQTFCKDDEQPPKSVVRNLAYEKEPYLVAMLKAFKEEANKNKQVREKRKENMKNVKGLNEEININLIKGQLGRLWTNISEDVLKNIAKQLAIKCAEPSTLGSPFQYLLVQYLYMEIRDEKDWENVREVANYAPLMTEKQSRVLALLIQLNEADCNLGVKPNHRSQVIKELICFIRYSIFGKDGSGLPRMQSFKISQLANLTRMFMALVRFKGDERTARMFLFDVMFFRSPRSHVMINVFFDTWPEIIFWTGQGNSNIDPLLETIIWMIYNTGPSTSLADMKVYESRNKLEKLCGFPNPHTTGDALITHLIEQTKNTVDDSFIKESTAKSLLLLAKWQEWKWSHNHIISRLLKVMEQCEDSENHDSGVDKPQKMLTWVIDCIGNISRVYPADGREHLRGIFDPIKSILTNKSKSTILDGKLEDACLKALVWTGHHLQAQVAEFLISWKPTHEQSLETINLVKNFVGTRALKYSETTINIWKKKKVFDSLNARKN